MFRLFLRRWTFCCIPSTSFSVFSTLSLFATQRKMQNPQRRRTFHLDEKKWRVSSIDNRNKISIIRKKSSTWPKLKEKKSWWEWSSDIWSLATSALFSLSSLPSFFLLDLIYCAFPGTCFKENRHKVGGDEFPKLLRRTLRRKVVLR